MVLVINGVLTAAFGLPWGGLLALTRRLGVSSLCFGVLLFAVALQLRVRWNVQHSG
jgi:hypothetical protein